MLNKDYRQRFFIEHSPVRGDVVRLSDSFTTVISQKDYPPAIKALLGEMLVSASLLIGTLKIDGKLSIQLQSSDDNSPLRFAMAECDHSSGQELGAVRALASFDNSDDKQAFWQSLRTSDNAFAVIKTGVLFISIHPNFGESYQGIVERVSDNLGECLAHYQKQSAQIPTIIKLATDETTAGGLLVQLLPQSDADKENDPDLWDRLSVLTSTIKADELTELPADEILYRLYHEEDVVLPEPTPLGFACTCSPEKSEGAILQLGHDEALEVVDAHGGTLTLDCGFCGREYRFDKDDIKQLFA
ncbi:MULTISPECIES: Hsp33 family molecular chaperone HslO [Moraxella]|mgnify:FL=1|uniref:Heat-shock protein Hsp33 n=1 Tax=Moraxella lacunata TaxID=477 RepID=A0A1B8Q888_MORLA|nr:MULTISPECIES: Hsp33 family molecular chaperone HslO [Moraxella]MBE9578158.1 Hsp33 family molecular chaperone HslO [Moraxella sp. K1664]MBE9587663.1 Hsp33 family molecular chaperone HslO [Moraxella sp. K1630]MBE9595859.1 Hsp33 family molecular chaperone HslO [Moraxella sp. K2450]MDH9219478.1 Hsp33 family molecular chaperone HslO [Moraxella lacunata]MDI4482205.1 redox-regulated molecular chaperone Hsp33 [Moraxella lacunata]